MLKKGRNPFHEENRWSIPEQTRSEYSQLFEVYDQDHDGYLLGHEVKPIFTKSKLDNTVLVSIWYVDICCGAEEEGSKERNFSDWISP
jgi:Ca2+-binding EF-hand superfamily protein